MGERGKPLPIETLPRDELEKIQDKLVRSIVKKAYGHSRHWHKKFESLKIKPSEIKCREDLRKAYVKGLRLTDEDLSSKIAEIFSDYLGAKPYTLLTTSGTGKRGHFKQIPYTDDDFKRTNDQLLQLYNEMGVSKGEMVINALGSLPNASGIMAMKALETVGASHIEVWVDMPSSAIQDMIKTHNAKYFLGLGSKVLELGNYLEAMGMKPHELGINKIAIGGEPFSLTLKEKIKNLWNAEVFDVYASAECGIVGFDCHSHNGLHVTENRTLVDIVDPERGEVKEREEEGTVLVTLLYDIDENPGTFMINKEMGDASKILDTTCECGRSTFRINYPYRVDDIFSIEAKKFNARAVEKILYDDNFTGNYVVVKYTNKETGKLEKLQIRTEVKELSSIYKNNVQEAIDAFAESNPLSYEILQKLKNENRIEVLYMPKNELFKGMEAYLRKGKAIRFIEILV
jgi:phenylacetate-CoA ligase